MSWFSLIYEWWQIRILQYMYSGVPNSDQSNMFDYVFDYLRSEKKCSVFFYLLQ